MIESLTGYEQYKPSGVPSLGDIPAHWDVRYLRSLARRKISNGVGLSARPFRSDWPRYIRITDISGPRSLRETTRASLPPEVSGERLEEGDLLFAAVGATYGKSVQYSASMGDCCFAGFLVRVSPSKHVLPGFLSHWAQSCAYWDQVNARVIQATIQNFSAARYKTLRVPFPSLDEQRAIVRFLDHTSAQAGRAIAAKRKTIALLNEQKQVIINEAVTRGFASSPLVESSELSWLSAVPGGWKVVRAKTVFDVIDERSTTGAEELLTVSSARGIVPRASAAVTMFKASSYVGHKLCSPGDLVVNSLWAWAGGLGVSQHRGIVSTAYSVYRLKPEFESYADFLHEALRSIAYKWEFGVRSKGIWISRLQLSDESFMAMPILLPPKADVGRIVAELRAALVDIDASISTHARQIDLLSEYRTRLVSDVVTGKLDVREAAKSLPDHVAMTDQSPENAMEIVPGNTEMADAE